MRSYGKPDYQKKIEENKTTLLSLARIFKNSRDEFSKKMTEVVNIVILTNDYLLTLYNNYSAFERENRSLMSRISNLESRIRGLEQFISAQEIENWISFLSECKEPYVNVLKGLTASRKEYAKKFDEIANQQFQEFKDQFSRLNQEGANSPDRYARLQTDIIQFQQTFRRLGTEICMVAEKDAQEMDPGRRAFLDEYVNNLLELIEVDIIEPDIGMPLNPVEHKTVEEKAGPASNKGKILKVVQRGYKGKSSGEIFKHAMVVVGG